MPTLEELTAWSVADLEAEISELLAENQILQCQNTEGYWDVRVLQDGVCILLEENPDRRLALLNLFGRLWSKHNQTEGSAWNRRTDFKPPTIMDMFVKLEVPDPEDLDPVEVSSLRNK